MIHERPRSHSDHSLQSDPRSDVPLYLFLDRGELLGRVRLHGDRTLMPACHPLKRRRSPESLLRSSLLLLCIGLQLPARQKYALSLPATTAPLNSDQVVDKLIAMNLKRAGFPHVQPHGDQPAALPRLSRLSQRQQGGRSGLPRVCNQNLHSPFDHRRSNAHF